jgi:hypothetical protein
VIGKRNICDRLDVNIFKPGYNSILKVIKSYRAIRASDNQKWAFNFNYIDSSLNLFASFSLFICIHQIYIFYSSSLFRLIIILHNNSNIPHNNISIFSSRNHLSRLWNKNCLSISPKKI